MSADQGVTSSNLIGPLKSFIYLFLKVMCLDSNLCFVYLNLYFFWLVTIVCKLEIVASVKWTSCPQSSKELEAAKTIQIQPIANKKYAKKHSLQFETKLRI